MADERTMRSYAWLLGPAGSEWAGVVMEAARMAGINVLVETARPAVSEWHRSEQGRPCAILVDAAGPSARASITAVRSELALASVPTIALVDPVTDLSYEDATSRGVDDCCPRSVEALGRRLRVAAKLTVGEVEARSEQVLIADPSPETRMLVARVFRNAGYRVTFAQEPTEALGLAAADDVQIVVCSAGIDGADADVEPVSRRAQRRGDQAAWIVNTPPKDIPATLERLRLQGTDRIAVHDAFSAPDNLLFVANELLCQPARDLRGSARLLYGTTVYFRPAGREVEHIGYSYNISASGLYVRTLAPIDPGEMIWVEFVPPRSDRRVHLEAEVVWKRSPGPGHRATVPSGFGVRITGAAASELSRYQRSYETFLAERTAERAS